MHDEIISDIADNLYNFIRFPIMDTLSETPNDLPATVLVMNTLKYLYEATGTKHNFIDIDDSLFNLMIREVGEMFIKASLLKGE